MGQGFLGQVDAAQHPCDFFDAVVLAQFGYGRASGILAAHFMYKQMLMALRRHLRQVRNGEDLSTLAETAQQLANDFGGGAADADVHFVKHQGRYA
ncbi:hypothetical protein D3C84_931890 [compost metagenome]